MTTDELIRALVSDHTPRKERGEGDQTTPCSAGAGSTGPVDAVESTMVDATQ